ncbi:FAD/NAD(P)-binding protein [Flavobacterium sp.]|uniref:NAD(P)-binding protein n=1 Tax=Flavobacterium sp. TaxID=239 RepID=UPI00262929ED|nr:FAD/NAD(P)-binding protein [Flavobacterium sp.]
MLQRFDKIIFGAGLYGLYAADFSARNNERILVLEFDNAPFERATYINQARVHMGYHYPRSFSTAVKSANYYEAFSTDFEFAIKDDFDKIYAISQQYSWTNAAQFEKFCTQAEIPCIAIDKKKYFKEDMVESAFLSRESTFDAQIIRDHFVSSLNSFSNVEIKYNVRIDQIYQLEDEYRIRLSTGQEFATKFVLNATYASLNQIITKLPFKPIELKYELCEVILCKVSDSIANVGITIMDGPFFSLMPFGKTGLHSLTAVSHTPHKTSSEKLPTFDCQSRSNNTCSPKQLANCNTCSAKPSSAWPFMSKLARKYLKDDIELEYVDSLFSVKTILKTSEVDDARPTLIVKQSKQPTFVSVLSGKINTIYDLNQILKDGNFE